MGLLKRSEATDLLGRRVVCPETDAVKRRSDGKFREPLAVWRVNGARMEMLCFAPGQTVGRSGVRDAVVEGNDGRSYNSPWCLSSCFLDLFASFEFISSVLSFQDVSGRTIKYAYSAP